MKFKLPPLLRVLQPNQDLAASTGISWAAGEIQGDDLERGRPITIRCSSPEKQPVALRGEVRGQLQVKTWTRSIVLVVLGPTLAAAGEEFDPLHDLAQFEPRCNPSHIGFFGDVTTVLGPKIMYRIGRGAWRTVPIELNGAHSIAKLANGAWLINQSSADQMIQLDDLEGRGRTITRSELGGFALSRPHDHVVDPETGYIYLVDGNQRLFRFRDLSGPVDVWTFPPNQMGYIRGMSWFDGRLHLADATRGEVHRIEDFDKRLKTTFRSPSPPPPKDGPVPTRYTGGGSLSATGLVLNDVEKFGDWYYGTNFFAPSFAQGGDPRPARIIRWRSWDDFERGEWQDLTHLLPTTKDPIIAYFMTVRDDSIFFTVGSFAPSKTDAPPSYKCFVQLHRKDLEAGKGDQ